MFLQLQTLPESRQLKPCLPHRCEMRGVVQ